MRRVRIIPTLLLDENGGLVKTVRFGKRTYIGDPINAVKIFNEKGADELPNRFWSFVTARRR